MRILRFERLNQVITISTVPIDNKILDRLDVKSDLFIKFSDYVKSQLHLNLVTDLLHRNINEYFNAYKYLTGDLSCFNDCITVVKYFYYDLAHFLLNNKSDIQLDLEIDAINIPSLNLKDGSKMAEIELQKIIDSVTSGNLINVIEKSQYSFLIDYVEDIDDFKVKLSSYSTAAFILVSLNGGIYENLCR